MGNELILGDKLRQARLNKNISIDELQKKTKIQKRYLEAIESGNFDILPGDYYVRAFIRQYAAIVGLDGDYLVAVFDGKSSFDAPLPKREVPVSIKESRVEKKSRDMMDSAPLIVLGLLAFTIITIVMYMMWQDRRSTPIIDPKQSQVEVEKETMASTESSTSEKGAETTTSSVEEKKMSISMKNPTQSSVDIHVTNAKKPFELTFKGKNDRCWIGVSVDGNYIYQYMLLPGEEQTTQLPDGAKDAMITLGASANVDIFANKTQVTFDDPQFQLLQKYLHLKIAYEQ